MHLDDSAVDDGRGRADEVRVALPHTPRLGDGPWTVGIRESSGKNLVADKLGKPHRRRGKRVRIGRY